LDNLIHLCEGQGNYLLQLKRSPTPLVLLASWGLGLDFQKYIGPMNVGRKSCLKLAHEKEIKELNQGKQRLTTRALRVVLNPSSIPQ